MTKQNSVKCRSLLLFDVHVWIIVFVDYQVVVAHVVATVMYVLSMWLPTKAQFISNIKTALNKVQFISIQQMNPRTARQIKKHWVRPGGRWELASGFSCDFFLGVVEDLVHGVDDPTLLMSGQVLQPHADGLSEEGLPRRGSLELFLDGIHQLREALEVRRLLDDVLHSGEHRRVLHRVVSADVDNLVRVVGVVVGVVGVVGNVVRIGVGNRRSRA